MQEIDAHRVQYLARSGSAAASLQNVAHAAVILASLVYVGGRAVDWVNEGFALLKEGGLGQFEQSAYTAADKASITLTNRTRQTHWACVQGQVVRKADRENKINSAVVCTGDMRSMTSVTLEAPYPVGKVREMCAGGGGLGMIDWSLCDFDVVDASFYRK